MSANDGQNTPDDSLGRAANRYVSFQIVSAVIGGIIFLIVLFAVILPQMNHVNQGFSQNFPQPAGMPTPMPGGSVTVTTPGPGH